MGARQIFAVMHFIDEAEKEEKKAKKKKKKAKKKRKQRELEEMQRYSRMCTPTTRNRSSTNELHLDSATE